MRSVLLLALLALPIGAQNVTIGTTDAVGAAKALYRLPTHPKQSFAAIKQHPLAMLSASLTLGLANGADYATTELGPGRHPAQFCEQVFTTNQPCQLNQPVFKQVKFWIAVFDAAQWAPVIFAPHWKYQQAYQATVVIVDGGLAIPMLKAVGGNVSALSSKGYLFK